mgnify:CR=1 FL=1
MCLCSEISPNQLLESAIKRLDGIDHTMDVNILSLNSKDETIDKSFSSWDQTRLF